jgi:hypothetical protein
MWDSSSQLPLVTLLASWHLDVLVAIPGWFAERFSTYYLEQYGQDVIPSSASVEASGGLGSTMNL